MRANQVTGKVECELRIIPERVIVNFGVAVVGIEG